MLSAMGLSSNQTLLNQKNTANSSKEIDANKELEKWKIELVKNNFIGSEVDFESLEDPAAEKWMEENPEQANALPKDAEDYKIVRADFNKDGKNDLLMYFISYNAIGHNGGSPYYAKIVYSDGTSNTYLMQEIMEAILNKYNQMRKKDMKLKKVSKEYMDEGTSISYKNGIVGDFYLYADGDCHAAPSYQGEYKYDPLKKEIEIKISRDIK